MDLRVSMRRANLLTRNLVPTCVLFVLCFCSSAFAEKEWPFYVPKKATPPTVRSDWPRNDIDRFILEKLNENELKPADEVSKRTLLRRVYFDLIGLPPTPSEIDQFLNNGSEDAYEKLVDRLLDDPRYGERWARFWLDLARYADTAGYEGDPDLPHAWRYRDYVIDSLNRDKPYDQFIKEQIAGDEFKDVMGAGDLPGTSAENTVAMTFLRLAPFTEPRGDETRHEMLSEMTSTVGSVFLGLTVGCAKCHDHKHDEIPTEDFYRMKAFFATVQIPRPEPGDIFQIGGSLNAKFYREGENDWASKQAEAFKKQAAEADKKLAALKQQIAKRLGESLQTGAGFGIQVVDQQNNDYVYAKESVEVGQPYLGIVDSNGKSWNISSQNGASDLGSLSGKNRGKWFSSLKDAKHISLGKHTAGTGEPKDGKHQGKFAEILIYDHPLDETERKSLNHSFRTNYLSGTKAAGLPVPPPQKGLRFWLHAADVESNGEKITRWVDRVGNVALEQDDESLQPTPATLGSRKNPAVDFESHFLSGNASNASFLDDSQGTIAVVYSARHQKEGYGLEIGGGGEFLTTFVNPAAASDEDKLEQLIRDKDPRITAEEQREFEFVSSRSRFVPQHLKRLKPVAMSLRHSYGPPYEPGVPVSRVMLRGEYDNPGDVVEPGFLSVITGNQDPTPIRLDPFKRWPTRSRRMALAKWIASPENPMTARVMVNRLWHWHFGQGIVTTPSDFGYLSTGPSHQELLDWLAVKFVEEKWSLKSIHRLIVTSATYRQSSSQSNAQARKTDPDNRLLSRFNRRRLDAEAVRDHVLAVSGRLNPEQFGLPIFPPLPGDVAETVKYDNSKWDTQYGPEGRKRSVYIYQQRTLTMPLMQTFDSLVCEETRPMRRSSVTPLQALAMYNGDFVNEEAIHFAKRVRGLASGDRAQVRTAFEISLGRKPNKTEATRLLDILNASPTPAAGLVRVCRVLFNTNEFIYID